MAQLKAFPKGKMVKLKPKIAVEIDAIAQERGTNVNALTNRVMRKFYQLRKKRIAEQSTNTMPTETA